MIAKLKSLLGLSKKQSRKTVFIGGGRYVVSVPSHWVSEVDEQEGMVLVFPKGCEEIILRFNVLSFAPTDRSGAPATGYRFVAESAKPNLHLGSDRAISLEESRTQEEGESLIIKHWNVGFADPSLVIVTATILERALSKAAVRETLEFLPEMLGAISPAQQQGAVETLQGQVEYTTTQVEPSPQQIRPINQTECDWVRDQEEVGRAVSAKYAQLFQNTLITTDLLDAVFAAWMEDASAAKPDPEKVSNGLGVLFGQILVSDLGMEWVKVNDEYGSEFGVRLVGYELMSFPIAVVQKRIEAQEMDFFSKVYSVIRSMLDNKEDYKKR